MWKQVGQGERPYWAVALNGLWQHDTGYWLTNTTNNHSTLWELRYPTGVVCSNQMDLPFKEGLSGPPLMWAEQELARKKGA